MSVSVANLGEPRLYLEVGSISGVPNPGPAIKWDTREADLSTQTQAATFGHGHAQALTIRTPAEVKQIVDFESGIFSAQSVDSVAHDLDAAGATGGPVTLSTAPNRSGRPASRHLPAATDGPHSPVGMPGCL